MKTLERTCSECEEPISSARLKEKPDYGDLRRGAAFSARLELSAAAAHAQRAADYVLKFGDAALQCPGQ